MTKRHRKTEFEVRWPTSNNFADSEATKTFDKEPVAHHYAQGIALHEGELIGSSDKVDPDTALRHNGKVEVNEITIYEERIGEYTSSQVFNSLTPPRAGPPPEAPQKPRISRPWST